jgi:MarR family transcriptional regulator, 2-MHQ and catechol-resistance regulon repressor
VLDDRRESYYGERLELSGPLYANFERPSAEIALGLLYTYELLHQQMLRCMTHYGLSKSTINILMLLRHGPDKGMQLHELGELLLVSRANITGLIDHLEGRGLVRREIDPEDRRARYARITPTAEALLDEYMPLHYSGMRVLLQDLSGKEKAALADLLRKTRLSIRTHAAEILDPVTGSCAKSAPGEGASKESQAQ